MQPAQELERPPGATQDMYDPSRRDFLKTTASLAGSLVVAVTWAVSKPAARAAAAKNQLNAWLIIGSDEAITVLVDRSEMGQGVYTALPTLLAEELEVDPARITVAAAPAGDAYVNALNGGQITGTSNSIPEAWDKLRKAGAQARSLLILAAARRWGVAEASCRAINGRVINAQGASYTYGQLALAAAETAGTQRSIAEEARRVSLDRPAATTSGYAWKGRWQRAVWPRREVAGHAVCLHCAVSAARRQAASG